MDGLRHDLLQQEHSRLLEEPDNGREGTEDSLGGMGEEGRKDGLGGF